MVVGDRTEQIYFAEPPKFRQNFLGARIKVKNNETKESRNSSTSFIYTFYLHVGILQFLIVHPVVYKCLRPVVVIIIRGIVLRRDLEVMIHSIVDIRRVISNYRQFFT